ncbi:MAG: antitoxin VapB family protein [Nitrososphaerales archaeon]
MTKTLGIRDEVYRKLTAVKEENESFSDLFERLLDCQSPQELLKNLRGKIELGKDHKHKLLGEINRRRQERRNI